MNTMSKIERDPHGFDPHSPGAKLDAGKSRVSLVLGGFPRALEEVSKVGTYGARKYTDDGWMTVPNGFERYTDALHRHQLREWQGEDLDPDTQLSHAAHMAWNALARLELLVRSQKTQETQLVPPDAHNQALKSAGIRFVDMSEDYE